MYSQRESISLSPIDRFENDTSEKNGINNVMIEVRNNLVMLHAENKILIVS